MATVKVTGGHKWEAALRKYKASPLLRAGILEGSTNGETGELIAPYAAANEFGAPDIPARPFMRTTVASKKMTWPRNLAAAIRAGRPMTQAMGLVGIRIVEDLQATIKSAMPPPNSPETMEKKNAAGAGKGTLIDTGSMLKSIDYEVIP